VLCAAKHDEGVYRLSVGKFEGPARTAPRDRGREAEQVSRLRYLAAVSKLAPDFAEEFLTLSFVKSFDAQKSQES
jgi:chorismate mutase